VSASGKAVPAAFERVERDFHAHVVVSKQALLNDDRDKPIACDDHANLVIEFDNGMQLRFTGSPKEETAEPWQVGSSAAFETGGYLLIATYAGGYAIWDYTAEAG
jgi:hypothetical protein